MKQTKITVYTTPTCGGCAMLKKQIPDSEFADQFFIEEINDENRDFLKENKVSSVPALYIEVGTRNEWVIGYRPITMIDNMIKELIKY